MIEASQLVTDVYGYWPRFEGAYVLAATIEADATIFYELGERTFSIDLHWWLGAEDHYPGGPIIFEAADLHRRIRMAFCVQDLRLHTFFCSNPQVCDLVLTAATGAVSTEGGFELSFKYDAARVVSVTPCDEIGRPL